MQNRENPIHVLPDQTSGTAILHKNVDHIIIGGGNLALLVAGKAEEVVASIPGARTALRIADITSLIWAGPLRAGLALAEDRAVSEVTHLATQRFEHAEYDQRDVVAASAGVPLVIAMMAGGVTGALALTRQMRAPALGGEGAQPPLRTLHSERSADPASTAYWSRQDTPTIVRSLRPGSDEALRVKSDGTIMNGNTRTSVLRERGYPVDHLPRTIHERGKISLSFDDTDISVSDISLVRGGVEARIFNDPFLDFDPSDKGLYHILNSRLNLQSPYRENIGGSKYVFAGTIADPMSRIRSGLIKLHESSYGFAITSLLNTRGYGHVGIHPTSADIVDMAIMNPAGSGPAHIVMNSGYPLIHTSEGIMPDPMHGRLAGPLSTLMMGRPHLEMENHVRTAVGLPARLDRRVDTYLKDLNSYLGRLGPIQPGDWRSDPGRFWSR